MKRAHTMSIKLVVIALVCAFVACEREQRNFRQAPPSVGVTTISQSDLHPGGGSPALPPTENPDEQNAPAVSEGQQLFEQYNCAGCHFHGGGGIGPPLMDKKWIYGSDPANIFSTIVEGRPNGMPSFRGKIPDYQVWEIAAYVRSLSGQVRKDVAPAREDHMYGTTAPESTKQEQPVNSGIPKSAERP